MPFGNGIWVVGIVTLVSVAALHVAIFIGKRRAARRTDDLLNATLPVTTDAEDASPKARA